MPPSSFQIRVQRAAVAFILALTLAGCVDLSAVATFSRITAETTSYTSLVGDYVDSASRELRYAPNNADLQKAAEEANANKAGLLAIQHVITEYMTAVGKLAGDQKSGVSTASGKLVDSMVSTTLIPAADKAAANALADLVVQLATQGFQEKELRSIIGSSNVPFQRLVGTLEKFVGTEYPARLNAEEGLLRQALYENIVDNNQLGPEQRPAKVIASILYSERVADLDAKKAAAEAYLPILEKIGAGHQALYDNRDKLDAKDLASQLKGYSEDIKVLYNQLKP